MINLIIKFNNMKNKIFKFNNNIKEYLENNKKNITINFLIFLAIIFILLLIDLLTKGLLFQWENEELLQGLHQLKGERYRNWLFGIRSVSNSGLTSFGNLLPTELVHFFNFIVLLLCLIFLIMLKSHWFAVSIAFIFSGTLGNMIDRFAFNGNVRDIIFLPWLDRGTFNFADVDAIIGSTMASIVLILQIFKDNKFQK